MTQTFSPLDRSLVMQRLRDQARDGRLHPSLLLVGPEGSAKEAAALELAVELLRPAAAGPSDGLFGDMPASDGDKAAAERRVRQLSHPDLFWVCPVESQMTAPRYRELLDEKAQELLARVRQPGSAIIPIGGVDDPGVVSVRAVRRFVNARPFEAARRVVIIADAHRMNRQAANALLKTLEEPPDASALILCTHQPHLLPSTVRSRCARVPVPALSETELARYLQDRQSVAPSEAARIAAVAGGNARRAFDLLDPVARELAAWAETLLESLLAGHRSDLARSAERVAKGQAPVGKGKSKLSNDASLAANRDLNIRLIDFMVADLVAMARQTVGAQLDTARADSLPPLRGHSVSQLTATAEVLQELRADLARNVNVGLVMLHGLLEACDILVGRDAARS